MAAYTPSAPPLDPSQIGVYLQQELYRIARSQTDPVAFVVLEKLTRQPAKLFDGMTVRADGTVWNPGAGAGVYCYYNGSWNKLG